MAAGRFHIIIDAINVPNQPLTDEEGLKTFLIDLTEIIDMHILKGPEVVAGIPENPGLSGFVIIDFSHISIHTFIEHKQALVDIFSCKSFDQEIANNAVLDYFQASVEDAKIQQVSWE